MSDYDSCPNCGREAKEAISSNWFPLFVCQKCDTLFCHECGGRGQVCPRCGSDDTQESVHRVYYEE